MTNLQSKRSFTSLPNDIQVGIVENNVPSLFNENEIRPSNTTENSNLNKPEVIRISDNTQKPPKFSPISIQNKHFTYNTKLEKREEDPPHFTERELAPKEYMLATARSMKSLEDTEITRKM